MQRNSIFEVATPYQNIEVRSSQVISSPREKARKKVIKIIKDNATDAAEVCLGTGAWVAIYWAEDMFEALGKTGYPLHAMALGAGSNIAATIPLFMREGCSSKTLKEAFKYVMIFLPLDAGFMIVEDYITAIDKSGAFYDLSKFEKYTDQTFTAREALAGLICYWPLYSLVYGRMSKLMDDCISDDEGDEVDEVASSQLEFLFECLSVGSQYFLFYVLDSCFKIDLDPVEEGVKNLFLTSFIMGFYSFFIDTVVSIDLWRNLKRSRATDVGYDHRIDEENGGAELASLPSVQPVVKAPLSILNKSLYTPMLFSDKPNAQQQEEHRAAYVSSPAV